VIVIKIGGQELDDANFLAGLATVVHDLAERPVIVHGGGKGSTRLAARLGIESRFVDGLRVTDAEMLEVATMGLVGLASTQLVGGLVRGGVPALGLCGIDAGLVRVKPTARRELGFVGEPVQVDAARLRALVEAGFVPCIAPICASPEGQPYNVNADVVAAAVAGALDAQALAFVTASPGVLEDRAVLPRLTPPDCERLIEARVITDGMVPKVRAACDALAGGVRRTLILDLPGLAAWASGRPAGTEVSP
jgi:acetylglutamate kinase